MLRKLVLAAALFTASAVSAGGPACFSPPDQAAAHLRALSWQFQVASLSCQTLDPSAPTFRDRYARYVALSTEVMDRNRQILVHHFGSVSAFDRWNTQVSNRAQLSVMNQADFCQVQLDRFEQVAAMTPASIETFAAGTEAAADLAPLCPAKKPAATKKKAKS